MIGWHNWTNQQTNHIAQHLENCFGHSEMLAPKSIIKVVRYNYIPELSCTTAFPNSRDLISRDKRTERFGCFFTYRATPSFYCASNLLYTKKSTFVFNFVFRRHLAFGFRYSESYDFDLFDLLEENFSFIWKCLIHYSRLSSQLWMETLLLTSTEWGKHVWLSTFY